MGRSQSAVAQYVLRLETMGLFAKVNLVETRREPFLDGQAIAFRVACDFKSAERRKEAD